jgi:hypothetical protein
MIKTGTGWLVIEEPATGVVDICKVDYNNGWSNNNPGGWTYQDYCHSHGRVSLETIDRLEAEEFANKAVQYYRSCGFEDSRVFHNYDCKENI